MLALLEEGPGRLLRPVFYVYQKVKMQLVAIVPNWPRHSLAHLSRLDVAFAALGNDQVVPLLVDRSTAGTHRFRDKVNYQNNLAAARNVIDAQQPSEWDVNLYAGWLATLRELSKPTTDAKYPEALRTKAWAMKSLNTQLASWTHLRRDTILYAKQSYTSGADCFCPAGFVEPVPHVWARVEKMVQHAAKLIENTPFPDGTAV
jgi:hypothetical protein